MHDEYYDDTDADYHTTDYIPKMRKFFKASHYFARDQSA